MKRYIVRNIEELKWLMKYLPYDFKIENCIKVYNDISNFYAKDNDVAGVPDDVCSFFVEKYRYTWCHCQCETCTASDCNGRTYNNMISVNSLMRKHKLKRVLYIK